MSRMKLTLKALSFAVVASASTWTVAAEAPLGLSFSGSTTLTSDYRYRGMTQTLNDPAIQGGFALAHDSGFYAGVWASNVDFGSTAHLEVDPYLGFATSLTNVPGAPTLDVGVWYYSYPSESDTSWLEAYAKLGFDDIFVKGSNLLTAVNYTNDLFGLDQDAIYVNATYSLPLGTSGLGAVASLGYTKADEKLFGDEDSYLDWKAGVTYSFASVDGLTAELAAVGTDIDYGAGTAKSVERGVETGAVFTITKTF